MLDIWDVIEWVREYYPAIESYFDRPRTLEELVSLNNHPAPGYEIHHIVERTSALRDGFPKSQVDGYDNRVRIPTYKHHEITTWYAESNDTFGGMSPRTYLQGKSWAERDRVGLYALRRFEVLSP